MKKVLKNPIFTFILGIVIFGSITGVVASQVLSDNLTYNGKDVTSELDKLYTKAEKYKKLSTETNITSDKILSGNSAYNSNGELINGSIATYTPSTVVPASTTQTLETSGKYANGNITVNAVPSTYQNLTSTTTVDETNLLSGKTAYKNDGTLVTGIMNTTDCIKGTVTCSTCGTGTQAISAINFNPTIFKMYGTDGAGKIMISYNKTINSAAFIYFDDNYPISNTDSSKNGLALSYSRYFTYKNNKLVLNQMGDEFTGYTMTYIACK